MFVNITIMIIQDIYIYELVSYFSFFICLACCMTGSSWLFYYIPISWYFYFMFKESLLESVDLYYTSYIAKNLSVTKGQTSDIERQYPVIICRMTMDTIADGSIGG